ncbi:hypothetical protein ACFC01_07910 [Streptomyces mirabilis]|uniref:hypothetical protein n=1 Tax=Streptomyces mirabilis TaxID=68239 RepID=UPI0035D594A6
MSDLRARGTESEPSAADPEGVRTAELAAAPELLGRRADAPLRLLPAHRTRADLTTCHAAFAVIQLLVPTGLFTVSFRGRLLWIPLLAAEAKPRAARKLARQRVVVRLEARHALETAALAAE